MSERLSDEFIRRLVFSQPIPAKLIRDLANAPDVPVHMRKYSDRRRPQMTPALWETLKLVAAGHTTRRIAAMTEVPFSTAQDRVRRLLAYFDARDRMDIVVRCYRERIF